MGAHLYDNTKEKVRELHINGQVFALARWQWIEKTLKKADKSEWLWQRWRPDHRFGHYPEPPPDAAPMDWPDIFPAEEPK